MKANKKTLMAVKRYLEYQEGWDLDEVIDDMVSETGLLKYKDTNNIYMDECDITWGKDNICNLDDFTREYSRIFIDKMCNILDSFVGDDIDCYFEDEE